MTATQLAPPGRMVTPRRRTTPPAPPVRPPHPTVRGQMDRVESAAIGLARRIGIPAMRIALGLTFLWFGALKITSDTPVADLVARSVDWLPLVDGSWFVPFLGAVEVLLGAALVVGKGLRAVLPLLFAHLAGTFLVLVTQPEVAFKGGNLLMLTTEGEFVVKNLILLSGVLILYASQRVRGGVDTGAPAPR